nr:FecR domain-containing protein [Pseudenhygromyxa sp. WMMC2535]
MFAWPSEHALEFQVDGVSYTAAELGTSIDAGDQPRVLAFSDSTRVTLDVDSRMRVDELRSNGATVTLTQGEVSLSVHHEDDDTSWKVLAGPYSVHVTGTEFSVSWQPASGDFGVSVDEGSVRVEGPEGEIASLRGGDSLFRARGKATIEPEDIDIDDSPRVIAERPSGDRDGERDGSRDGAEDSEPSQPPAGESSTEAPSSATSLSSHAHAEREPSSHARELETDANAQTQARTEAQTEASTVAQGWLSLHEAGSFAKAWDAVAEQPGGVLGEADRADADTMLELADLARYNKRRGDARTVLERVRVRFPGSKQASKAAFLLGKMAADGGDTSRAAVWFETYLDERPNGSFAADALGRLMASYQSLDQADDARSAAERYLELEPQGLHADKARKILGQ